MKTALTIAGSDPSGGAGIQADLQVFGAHGVHGAAVITALTVQDTAKVHQVLPVFPSVVLDQLRVLLRDLRADAVKIGMLGSDDVVRNVMLGLAGLREGTPLVIDPLLLASDGTPLLERRAWDTLRALIAQATLVTPNLAEAAELVGRDASSRSGSEAAARALVEELGANAALVTGGHRTGAPHDLLAVRGTGGGVELKWLEGERVEGAGDVHGTGCALSAAIAAGLARGLELEAAVAAARDFVARGLRAAHTPGGGRPFLTYA